MGRKRRRTTRFGRDLCRAFQEVLDIMDGKLEPAAVIMWRTLGCIATACGLSASQMASRLDLNVSTYLEREAVPVRLEGKVYQPPPEELLRQMVEAVKGENRDA